MEDTIEQFNLKPDRKILFLFNTVIFLTHVVYELWYTSEGMTILWAYNLFSIAVFTLNFYFAWMKEIEVILTLDFTEIFVFLTLNTLLLGWDYGFQYYTLGLLVTVLLVNLLVDLGPGMKLAIKVYSALLILDFVTLRIWLYSHPPLYPVHAYARYMYLGNAVLVFFLVIIYTSAMTKMVSSLQSHLVYVAGHDVLTGLLNRRSIEQTAAKGFSWVAVLDIDYFKRINDEYGHAAGDAALRTVGRILLSYEGAMTCGRYGGEEFLLCGALPPDPAGKEKKRSLRRAPAGKENGEPQEIPPARELLEGLRRRIECTPISFEGREFYITATIGIGDTIQQADARLYEGKRRGRNQVVAE